MVFVARKHLRLVAAADVTLLGFAIFHLGFYTALRLWRRDLAGAVRDLSGSGRRLYERRSLLP